jgi:hypothetical protein
MTAKPLHTKQQHHNSSNSNTIQLKLTTENCKTKEDK